jgi:hypothetical protein
MSDRHTVFNNITRWASEHVRSYEMELGTRMGLIESVRVVLIRLDILSRKMRHDLLISFDDIYGFCENVVRKLLSVRLTEFRTRGAGPLL